MQEIIDFFANLGRTEGWPPRWYCGKWSEFHGWLYIISDLMIWAAYFTIPFLLIHFISRKKNVPFPKIFWLFGTFIFACGTTHLIDAIIFWVPIYRISGLVRFFTAVVSWGTIIGLYKILPDAFSLKTPAELERVVQERTEELHLSAQKMRFLADAMPQIVWTARPDGARDYFNMRTIKYTGKTQEELVEWQWADLIHPDDREQYLKAWEESLNNGTDFEMEKRLLNADGHYHWHLSRAHAHYDENGNIVMWVGTATDIEQQKRAAELLEQKVNERTEQLRVANKELTQSNADLERFAAIASHDLQAPLRTVSNYLGMLAFKNKAVLDEKSNSLINTTLDATKRMRTLIANLLSYTKTNAAELNLAQVDLNKVMGDVMGNLYELINSRSAQVTYPQLPAIVADELQLTQVLQNLVANGIKYNESAQPVVTLTVSKEPGHMLFAVADNGVGIAAEDQHKVFEVFSRLQSAEPGSGLGLSICKRAVEKHNGRMWLESEPGKGTTFYFTIPTANIPVQ